MRNPLTLLAGAAGEYAPKAILGIFTTVHQALPQAVNSGVIGNGSHTYGYHRSRNRLLALLRFLDYSIKAALDKLGDGNAVPALDIGGPQSVLQMLCRRLVDASDARDPRIVGKLREFGGSLDGKRVTARRVGDNVAISFDSSHLWHLHLSVHRKYANDVEVCQGIAEVLTGVPLHPWTWDGKSCPPAWVFTEGSSHPAIQLLGERLVAWGFTKRNDGDGYQPGPEWSSYDQANVQDFQLAQGWKGGDADGIPGPITWQLLLSDPPTKPEPEPDPTPTPEPAPKPVVKNTAAHALILNVKGGAAGSFDARVPEIVQVLKDNPTSVVLLTECSNGQAAKIQRARGPRWFWRNELDLTVMYDSTVWDSPDKYKQFKSLPTPHSGAAGYERGLLIVGLVYRKTGELVWFAVTHFTANGYPKTMTPEQGAEERTLQAKSVVKILESFRYVLLGGDLNSYSMAADKPQAIFKAAGFASLRDRTDVEGRDKASFDGGKGWIDYAGIGDGLGFFAGGRMVFTGGASDHNGIYVPFWLRPRAVGSKFRAAAARFRAAMTRKRG